MIARILLAITMIGLLILTTPSVHAQQIDHYQLAPDCSAYMSVRANLARHPEWAVFLGSGDPERANEISETITGVKADSSAEQSKGLYGTLLKIWAVKGTATLVHDAVVMALTDLRHLTPGKFALSQFGFVKKYAELIGVSEESLLKLSALMGKPGASRVFNTLGKASSTISLYVMLLNQQSCANPIAQTYTYRPPSNPWSGQINFYKKIEMLFSASVPLSVACSYSRRGVLNNSMVGLNLVFDILNQTDPELQAEIVKMAYTKNISEITDILELANRMAQKNSVASSTID